MQSNTPDAPVNDGPEGIDAPVDAPPRIEHLYIANDQSPGGIVRYTLPLTQASTPDFTVSLANALDGILYPNGDLVGADNAGKLEFFPAPLSATSTPTAAFRNGNATSGGQLALTQQGILIAANQTATLNVFQPPFTDGTVATSSITSTALSTGIGAALDAGENLYVANVGGNGSNLVLFPPPYTTATVITPAVAGTAYRRIAIAGNRLFVSSVGTPQSIDAYDLPLVAGAGPVFSITSGLNAPEAVALDANGRLYIGNLSDSTVAVIEPPFSAQSVPALTLKVSTGPFAIFGLTVGP